MQSCDLGFSISQSVKRKLERLEVRWIKERCISMKFYQIDNQIVFSDKSLNVGTELIANITDGAHEKHVPQITIEGNTITVKVGSVEHPSLDDHYIEFILLVTSAGIHTKWLKPGMKPEAEFALVEGEKAIAAYEYCNLHGLWKAEV